MKNQALSLLILSLVILTGCIGEWDRKLDEKKVNVKVVSTDKVFTKKNLRVSINEYKNNLDIGLMVKLPKGFKFPVDSFYNDTLYETKMFMSLSENGKPITIDQNIEGYAFLKDIADSNEIVLEFNKSDLVYAPYKSKISVPMFLFHNLKSGKHTIQAGVFIKSFYGTHYDAETGSHEDIEIPCFLNIGNIEFELDVPDIYLTVIYGNGIMLRDDKTFSPRGMDFSFREGLPDIYWEIFYPHKSSSRESKPYWRSMEATYAYNYLQQDTVYLYHYGDNKTIKIGVYDRDDFSRDDFIGDWEGKIKELEFENEMFGKIKFDNVESFEIKAKASGKIN